MEVLVNNKLCEIYDLEANSDGCKNECSHDEHCACMRDDGC